jgi:hypothetical protein
VDALGGAVIDPTANVIALVRAEKERSDDLRSATDKYVDMRFRYIERIADLRAKHSKELRDIDVERNSAVRQVDITNATSAAAQIQTAIQALAKTTEDTRKTLADAMASRDTRVDERLGQLERTASLGEGKQRVSDPMMTELIAEVKKLSAAGSGIAAKSENTHAILGYIFGAVGMTIGIVGVVIAFIKLSAGA